MKNRLKLAIALRREKAKERKHPAYKLVRDCIMRVNGFLLFEDVNCIGIREAFIALAEKGEGLHVRLSRGGIYYLTRESIAHTVKGLSTSDIVPAMSFVGEDGEPQVAFFSEIVDVVPLCDVPENWGKI